MGNSKLLLNHSIDLSKLLGIIDKLVMPNNEFSKEGLEILSTLILTHILSADPESCSHALSIYGKLVSFEEYTNSKVHAVLEQAFKVF
jgi:hypothetical protein